MKVLLLHDVAGVGKAGDVANVADGYGRNYLIPRKLAMLASSGVMRNLDLQRKSIQRRAERERADAESVAARVQSEPITIEAHTGVGGKLYGSITSQNIADALKAKHGLEIDRRKIELHEPIKLVGTYTVPIRFMRDVVAQLTLNVTETGGAAAQPAAEAPAAQPAPETAPAQEPSSQE